MSIPVCMSLLSKPAQKKEPSSDLSDLEGTSDLVFGSGVEDAGTKSSSEKKQ